MNDLSPESPETRPHETKHATPSDPRQERGRRRVARLLGLCTTAVLAGVVAVGAIDHASERAEAVAAVDDMRSAVPVVRVATVKPVDAPKEVDLAGAMQAFDSATLFARATGYIGKRNVDIGSHVKKGDVLAVISAPDLDAQLEQARGQLAQMQAALAQAQANQDLAHATNSRTSRLVQQGWTSQEQGDTDRLTLTSRVAAVAVAQANVQAQQAQVDRLVELTGFERVVAPFNGVITARQVDVGSLVTADAASGSPLFSINRNDVLRVQVYVPQDAYFGLKDGEQATVTVPELPGRVFHGTVARNASTLQQQTRTLLTEVDVDNADGTLTAGLYGIVHLQEPRQQPTVMVPSGAVIFGSHGLRAAVFNGGSVQLRNLNVEADDGAEVEVRSGLREGDQLILNPPVDVTEGMRVATASTATHVVAANSPKDAKPAGKDHLL